MAYPLILIFFTLLSKQVMSTQSNAKARKWMQSGGIYMEMGWWKCNIINCNRLLMLPLLLLPLSHSLLGNQCQWKAHLFWLAQLPSPKASTTVVFFFNINNNQEFSVLWEQSIAFHCTDIVENQRDWYKDASNETDIVLQMHSNNAGNQWCWKCCRWEYLSPICFVYKFIWLKPILFTFAERKNGRMQTNWHLSLSDWV